MSEETTNTEKQEMLIEDTQSDIAQEEQTSEVELSELEKAIQTRMGQFEITISPSDLKYVKNILNNKIEWKGPNEAYLMLMAVLNISSELKNMNTTQLERVKISLPSATLESINFFLNRVTGKGEESAHRLFAISMLLRPAMEEIKKLDELIEKLQSEKN